MILDIYKDAFEYAGKDIKTLLKLGLLSIFSFLVVPLFLIMGYEYRVIETGIKGMIGGDDALPNFEDLIGMFIDGIKVFVVQFIYLIVPFIVFLIISFIGNSLNSGVLIYLSIIIGLILFIISELYSFLAIPNMIANNGSFIAAFDIKRLNEIIKMVGVGRYVVFYIGLLLLVTVISIVIAVILTIIFSLFGFAVFTINPLDVGAIFTIASIIFLLIFTFIVQPYLGIFIARAEGLIYGVGE